MSWLRSRAEATLGRKEVLSLKIILVGEIREECLYWL